MKTDLAAIYELIPMNLQVPTESLLALAAVEREFDALVAYTGARLRMMGVQSADREMPTLTADLEPQLDLLNASKRETGERALRALGLDPASTDYTIDEDSGDVYCLVTRVPA